MTEQGSQQWFLERCGCATASRFCDIIAISKRDGRPLKARDDYLWELASDRVYQAPDEPVSARSLEWGTALEPAARELYQRKSGELVSESGFILHRSIQWCGGSPDGLIGLTGGIEIKSPKTRRVHMETWLNGMPEEHIPQVQGNIWINDRQWWDFISFDPRAPEDFQLYVQRVYRDDKYILALESHVVEFLGQVQNLAEKLHATKNERLRRTDPRIGGESSTPVPRK